MYADEASLTQVFARALWCKASPFSPENSAREFDYKEGRIDVVLQDADGCLIAFELKLSRWRQALNQAYRNSSFAHRSYVVLPSKTARIAIGEEREFRRRGVGLCSVENGRITVEIEARQAEPLRPWLTKSAIKFLSSEEVCHQQLDSQT